MLNIEADEETVIHRVKYAVSSMCSVCMCVIMISSIVLYNALKFIQTVISIIHNNIVVIFETAIIIKTDEDII